MSLVKKSITLHGHRTSIALEKEFWEIVENTADKKHLSLASIISALDDQRIMENSQSGLASYIRVWALKRVQLKH